MRNFKNFLLIMSVMLTAAACGTGSLNGTSFGAFYGEANLNNGGGNPPTWGADLAHKGSFIMPGLTYNALTPNSTTVAGTSYSQGLSNLYAHAEVMWGDFGVGALAGINWWNNNAPNANNNTSNFIYGLLAHWDWNLGKNFSIGPRVNGIWNNASGAYGETDLLGVLKIWF